MKRSLTHLPSGRRHDLALLAELARAEIPGLEMVILFGSYARGNYVTLDVREEYGVTTVFKSDYDLLLITRQRVKGGWTHFERIVDGFYKIRGKSEDFYTHPELVYMTISEFNSGIAKARPFYTDIKREGIILYDSKELKLARRRKLDYVQIAEIAQEYFDEKSHNGGLFLDQCKDLYNKKEFVMASFMLHQATENLFATTILVNTLYCEKLHNLKMLIEKVNSVKAQARKIFPYNTPEEERLFDLLTDAYVQARYNKDFRVTREDLDALIPKVEQLREITEKECRERIAYYAALAAEGRDAANEPVNKNKK